MSRIGRAPIELPEGAEVAVTGDLVRVSGPNGTLEHRLPEGITVTVTDRVVTVGRRSDERSQRALHGLTRSLIANMVTGVTRGFTKELEIVGVGYRATAQGPDRIDLSLGFSHPVSVSAPEGVTFEVPAPTRIIVKGIDKQVVGQVAADIRALRRPEPYKGKGIRYAGERVRRKAGKAG